MIASNQEEALNWAEHQGIKIFKNQEIPPIYGHADSARQALDCIDILRSAQKEQHEFSTTHFGSYKNVKWVEYKGGIYTLYNSVSAWIKTNSLTQQILDFYQILTQGKIHFPPSSRGPSCVLAKEAQVDQCITKLKTHTDPLFRIHIPEIKAYLEKSSTVSAELFLKALDHYHQDFWQSLCNHFQKLANSLDSNPENIKLNFFLQTLLKKQFDNTLFHKIVGALLLLDEATIQQISVDDTLQQIFSDLISIKPQNDDFFNMWRICQELVSLSQAEQVIFLRVISDPSNHQKLYSTNPHQDNTVPILTLVKKAKNEENVKKILSMAEQAWDIRVMSELTEEKLAFLATSTMPYKDKTTIISALNNNNLVLFQACWQMYQIWNRLPLLNDNAGLAIHQVLHQQILACIRTMEINKVKILIDALKNNETQIIFQRLLWVNEGTIPDFLRKIHSFEEDSIGDILKIIANLVCDDTEKEHGVTSDLVAAISGINKAHWPLIFTQADLSVPTSDIVIPTDVLWAPLKTYQKLTIIKAIKNLPEDERVKVVQRAAEQINQENNMGSMTWYYDRILTLLFTPLDKPYPEVKIHDTQNPKRQNIAPEKVLGLMAILKDLYKQKALQLHPDKAVTDQSTEEEKLLATQKFQMLGSTYERFQEQITSGEISTADELLTAWQNALPA